MMRPSGGESREARERLQQLPLPPSAGCLGNLHDGQRWQLKQDVGPGSHCSCFRYLPGHHLHDVQDRHPYALRAHSAACDVREYHVAHYQSCRTDKIQEDITSMPTVHKEPHLQPRHCTWLQQTPLPLPDDEYYPSRPSTRHSRTALRWDQHSITSSALALSLQDGDTASGPWDSKVDDGNSQPAESTHARWLLSASSARLVVCCPLLHGPQARGSALQSQQHSAHCLGRHPFRWIRRCSL